QKQYAKLQDEVQVIDHQRVVSKAEMDNMNNQISILHRTMYQLSATCNDRRNEMSYLKNQIQVLEGYVIRLKSDGQQQKIEDDDYNCDSKDEDILDSGLCIFHDENYLQDKNNHKEHEQKVRDRLEIKVRNSIDQNEALLCVGYHLPDITIKQGNFTRPVYFSECEFQGLANFSLAKFSAEADFNSARFSAEANFISANFQG